MLFVCTGNICRSPIAERLFAARIDSTLPVLASSAGTAGLTGSPIDPRAGQVLRELGGDGGGHVARRLTPAMIAESDLILTSESSHRSEVVLAEPMAFRRVFSLREFGRLGAGLMAMPGVATEDELRSRVLEVASQRGVAPAPDTPDVEDIGDPFGAPLRIMRACGEQIAEAIDAAIAVLGLAVLPASADGRAKINR